MANEITKYREKLGVLFEEIEGGLPNIQAAAKVIADAIVSDKMVHVIGPGGHSNMGVEELLWRAGGLAIWNAILDPGTNLIHGAKRSNFIERTPGYAIGVLDSYRVGREPGEVIVIINAYGINSMTIDTVLECKRRGVFTIAVTSSSFAKIVPQGAKSRHPSNKNLYEEADIFIDNHLPVGDSVVEVEGFADKIGSNSTFCNCFALNVLVIEIVKELLRRGVTPPVFMSANMPDGDAHNRAIEEKYGPRIKHLL